MSQKEIFLGRQPILDRSNQVQAFEILFRSGNVSEAIISNVGQAAVGVILNTLSDFGLEEVVGSRHQAFFNVNAEILMSEMIELLPQEQVVIELLETIEINSAIINRCRELKKKGFRLALDDFVYKPGYDPLFEVVDIVKVDLLQETPESLEAVTKRLKQWPLTLLAEKVEDVHQYDLTRSLGFDLFQGYYFARPAVISGKRVDPASISVLKLMDLVLRDAELSLIETAFRESPSLSYNLLRLLNSVASGMREKISSVRHAIVLLGRERLNRWAQVLLFTYGDTPGHQNPLLSTAVMRGRLMELLIQDGALEGLKQGADLAFMTGMLSLVDVLLQKPMKEIVQQFRLADAVQEALLNRGGALGDLLLLVEKIEQSNYQAIDKLTEKFHLRLSKLFSAEQEAAIWTRGLTDAF